MPSADDSLRQIQRVYANADPSYFALSLEVVYLRAGTAIALGAVALS